jgi:hypothetical protein
MAPGALVTVTVTGQFTNPITGTLTLDAIATVVSDRDDVPGNNSITTPHIVGDIPITDLAVANIGLNYVNGTTTFSTTISAGSNVVYTWSYGDGTPQEVSDIQRGRDILELTHGHVYTSSAQYTAVVTASNGVSQQTVSLMPTILAGDLAITQTLLTPVVGPGDPVIYALHYVNQGQQVAEDSYILHFIPTELISVTVSAEPNILLSPNSGPIFDLATLAVGASGTITISGIVDPALTQSIVITNSAYINGNLADNVPQNNTTQEQLIIQVPTALVAVEISAESAPLIAPISLITIFSALLMMLVWRYRRVAARKTGTW